MGYTRRRIPSRAGRDPVLGDTLECCVQLWDQQDRRDKELQQRVTKMRDLEHLPDEQRLRELGLGSLRKSWPREDLSPEYPRGSAGRWIQALLHGARGQEERAGTDAWEVPQELFPGIAQRYSRTVWTEPACCGMAQRGPDTPSLPLNLPRPAVKARSVSNPAKPALLRDFKPRRTQRRPPPLTFSVESLMHVL